MSIKTLPLCTVAALTNAFVAEITSPANVTTRITGARACNTSAGTIKLSAEVTRNAVTAILISALPIGPGLTYNCPELVGVSLLPGETLSVKDDTGAVTSFSADGYQIS